MGQVVSQKDLSLMLAAGAAAATGDVRKLQATIEAGASVNAPAELPIDGPLHAAVRRRGNVECVNLLINAGADVNRKGEYDRSPLIIAVENNHVECVRALIAAGADTNSPKRLLEIPVNNGYTECLKMLLDSGADVNILSPSLLYVAVINGNPECLKLLLDAGADVNSWGSPSLLHIAVNNGMPECVKLLLEAGADVNSAAAMPDLSNWFRSRLPIETKIRCMQLLLTKDILVKSANSFCGRALESFLSFLGDTKNAEKGVRLLVAAGETDQITGLRNPFARPRNNIKNIQIKPREISLRNECRETIRRHLLGVNNINLFVRVPQLHLPSVLHDYLLYDVTLDEDYVTNDVSDDVDFIFERIQLPRFEHLIVD